MINYKEYSFCYCQFFAAGAFVGAAANVAGSAISGAISSQLQKDAMRYESEEAQINRDFQREERELAQQFNLEMWNMNNEYNSLSAQIDRAREAGVSPNALLGGRAGQIASNPVTTSPAGGAQAHFPGYGDTSYLNGIYNVGSSFADILNKVSASRNLDSNTALTDVETRWNEDTYDDRVKYANSQVKEIQQSINESLSRQAKNESGVKVDLATEEQILAGIPFIAHMKQAEIDVAVETANKIRVEYDEMRKNGFFNRANTYADTQLKNAQTDIVGSDARVAEATEQDRVDITQSEALLNKLKSAFSEALGVPLDAPEFQFMWYLNERGLLEQYIEEVQGASAREVSSSHSAGSLKYDMLRQLPDFILRLLKSNDSHRNLGISDALLLLKILK